MADSTKKNVQNLKKKLEKELLETGEAETNPTLHRKPVYYSKAITMNNAHTDSPRTQRKIPKFSTA